VTLSVYRTNRNVLGRVVRLTVPSRDLSSLSDNKNQISISPNIFFVFLKGVFIVLVEHEKESFQFWIERASRVEKVSRQTLSDKSTTLNSSNKVISYQFVFICRLEEVRCKMRQSRLCLQKIVCFVIVKVILVFPSSHSHTHTHPAPGVHLIV
jgi:hypothetical protein